MATLAMPFRVYYWSDDVKILLQVPSFLGNFFSFQAPQEGS